MKSKKRTLEVATLLDQLSYEIQVIEPHLEAFDWSHQPREGEQLFQDLCAKRAQVIELKIVNAGATK